MVLDHHADLLASKFEGLLSCGNWIKQALNENDSLKKVVLIGVSDELADAVKTDYKRQSNHIFRIRTFWE